MELLQPMISENRQSAFFYHGVIAECGDYKLETYQDGEIVFNGKSYIGKDTHKLVDTEVTDTTIEDELIVDILVDKFFTITKGGEIVSDELMFDTYSEGIEYLIKM